MALSLEQAKKIKSLASAWVYSTHITISGYSNNRSLYDLKKEELCAENALDKYLEMLINAKQE
jgi:hypothetical protein